MWRITGAMIVAAQLAANADVPEEYLRVTRKRFSEMLKRQYGVAFRCTSVANLALMDPGFTRENVRSHLA